MDSPKPAVEIKVKYSTIDRFSQKRTFKTLEGAQKYAQKWVGETPEISTTFQYAVSSDGTGKIEVEGCSIRKLFPKLAESGE